MSKSHLVAGAQANLGVKHSQKVEAVEALPNTKKTRGAYAMPPEFELMAAELVDSDLPLKAEKKSDRIVDVIALNRVNSLQNYQPHNSHSQVKDRYQSGGYASMGPK